MRMCGRYIGSDWSDQQPQTYSKHAVFAERKWKYCMYIVAMELSVADFLLLLIGCFWLVALNTVGFLTRILFGRRKIIHAKQSALISLCYTGKIIRHS